ncbi:glycerophosphoryl diester phosphodiesterase [Microbacterium terrae]|uniref:Glycerophosphoryl diester phosphodiesterase n=1 Tax=Microbacterium terrae TaxID=69369 RepID=A0A0M2H5F6_9MICO|nr:glycerophosphodiester phosphodiesterase family protein [Microbacterium terrae]KJL39065.1 Glycerophosphoryl diester phosphodiesterase [Microbacterium terrae]MBP1077780.1 glycerophosphoryl diester phosphodiesterase [Microbacterium terrae]GLJ99949.1 glycerophosphodiester phosphodiesterase [Microbacterium terrae]
MPHPAVPERAREPLHALVVVCVLAVASIVIAFLGATPVRVSSSELLGDVRTPGDDAFIASHRGGGAAAPENTLPAIRAALARGYDYVEVDVVLTRDRRPVLMHDSTVDRTTDGSGRVADLTLDQVRALDAGSWFHEEFTGTPVPTLAEFLDELARSGQRAIIELKGEWDADAVTSAVAEIDDRRLERRVAVASFDARPLALFAAASEVIPRMLILKNLPDDVVSAAAEAGVRGIIADRKAVLARPEVIDEVHAAEVRIVVYTLNSDTQWDAVTALGVDGIVTDDPRTLSDWQRGNADR